MVSENFIMPQLQLLTSNKTKLSVLQLVMEAASLSYKTIKEENDSMGKRIEAIMSTSRGSISFKHEEETNTTSNHHVNGINFLP